MRKEVMTMTLDKLMSWSESFTDEIQTESFALGYANKAIADINTEAGLTLPFIEGMLVEYTALPESWFVRLLLPYLNYGIKMNDTSVAEADRYKQEFEIALFKFKDRAQSVVAEVFINKDEQRVFPIDTTNSIDLGWFGGLR